jgi:hypothetical protein
MFNLMNTKLKHSSVFMGPNQMGFCILMVHDETHLKTLLILIFIVMVQCTQVNKMLVMLLCMGVYLHRAGLKICLATVGFEPTTFGGIQSKRPQVKTSPNLHSQNVPRPKRPHGQKPLTLVFK